MEKTFLWPVTIFLDLIYFITVLPHASCYEFNIYTEIKINFSIYFTYSLTNHRSSILNTYFKRISADLL